ncbi:hypothetical protein BDR03DRAFT_86119 [Suillus americanus]|nr:hypothetical protein BDR03DRAFT_86119 [Suillus americanus]
MATIVCTCALRVLVRYAQTPRIHVSSCSAIDCSKQHSLLLECRIPPHARSLVMSGFDDLAFGQWECKGQLVGNFEHCSAGRRRFAKVGELHVHA